MGLLRNRPQTSAPPPQDPGGSDAELVAQARQGDTRAFGLLYRRHVDAVYDFAAHRLAHREDAEDATQTIFLRAAQSLQQCRDDDAFAGWLFAIARNVVTDKLRSRRAPTAPWTEDLEVADPASPPDELAIQSTQRTELREARARCLNDAERELYDLLVQDLTYAEIAVALDRRINAVRTRYWRLLDKLRSCLGLLAKGGGHEAR
ncbi:MAG TPA: sigma-70 family RNA polymerase sigma factor [Thermomicrobiales bacterium]|jgi:RNA polymerase sigma-70 factor (ECF subfamily)